LEKEVKKTGIARMLELAFMKRGLIIAAGSLSFLSTLMSFIPYVSIYFIIREFVPHISNLSGINSSYMIKWGLIAGGSAVGAVLLNFIALMCSHLAAFKTQYKLKLDFTRHLASLPMGFHTQNSTGKLRKVVDSNIEQLEGFVAHNFPDIVGSFTAPIAAVVLMFAFDWRMGLACLVPIILSFAVQIVAMSGKKAAHFMNKYQTSLEDMNNAAVEYVRGISVVKAFNQTIFSFRKFHDTIKHYGDWVLAYTKSFKTPMVLFMTIISNVYLFVVPVAIWISGGVTDYNAFALSVIFYLIFALSLTGPFVKIMYVSQKGRQIADGIERMDRVLDTQPLKIAESPKETDDFNIEFNNVSFSYNDGEQDNTIENINFKARQGQITALVGPSGGGKTTIASLIPRFYDVLAGYITIGGTDIRDMSEDYLNGIVSFVFQDVFLFKQSVSDNILAGNKTASLDDVVAAAKAAQCHEFISALPNKYNTIIGTENIHLSGGERQRLVIARAILKNAPIIVLDEATAFADPENEQKIQEALSHLIKDKTVIIIAHRLSTIKNANNIVVIDEGKINSQGTHKQLIEKAGLYKKLWEQYTGAQGWQIAGGESNV